MQRFLTSALSLVFLAGLASGVSAKPCKDAHGKFIKCAPPMSNHMMTKKAACRDAHGKFTKCVHHM